MSNRGPFSMTSSAVWIDDDYRALPQAAKALYQQMLSHPNRNVLGIGPWIEADFVAFDPDTSPESVREALGILMERRYVIIAGGLYLVRSYLRHNLALVRNTKNASGIVKRYKETFPRDLRHAVLHELHRLRLEHPEVAGWATINELFTTAKFDFTVPISTDGSSDASSDGSVDTTVDTTGDPVRSDRATDRPSFPDDPMNRCVDSRSTDEDLLRNADASRDPEQPKPAKVPERFEEFWNAYGLKRDRGKAIPCYRKALKKTDPQTLIDAAAKHYAWQMSRPPKERYFPYAEKWLNGERWDDELPSKTITKPDGTRDLGLPHVDTLEQPPEDATDEEIAAWYASRRERTTGGRS